MCIYLLDEAKPYKAEVQSDPNPAITTGFLFALHHPLPNPGLTLWAVEVLPSVPNEGIL